MSEITSTKITRTRWCYKQKVFFYYGNSEKFEQCHYWHRTRSGNHSYAKVGGATDSESNFVVRVDLCMMWGTPDAFPPRIAESWPSGLGSRTRGLTLGSRQHPPSSFTPRWRAVWLRLRWNRQEVVGLGTIAGSGHVLTFREESDWLWLGDLPSFERCTMLVRHPQRVVLRRLDRPRSILHVVLAPCHLSVKPRSVKCLISSPSI